MKTKTLAAILSEHTHTTSLHQPTTRQARKINPVCIFFSDDRPDKDERPIKLKHAHTGALSGHRSSLLHLLHAGYRESYGLDARASSTSFLTAALSLQSPGLVWSLSKAGLPEGLFHRSHFVRLSGKCGLQRGYSPEKLVG